MRNLITIGLLAICASVVAPAQAQGSSQPGLRNGLPPTVMDSFVTNAAENADMIYGDEGGSASEPSGAKAEKSQSGEVLGYWDSRLPPYFGFTSQHRINNGILDNSNAGLTTGHGSVLPDAWGYDEFRNGTEWSMSGPSTSQQLNLANLNTSVKPMQLAGYDGGMPTSVDSAPPGFTWEGISETVPPGSNSGF